MTRPASGFWKDGPNAAGAVPLIPGLNTRDTAVLDYVDERAAALASTLGLLESGSPLRLSTYIASGLYANTTAALQQAMTDAAAASRPLYVQAGTYGVGHGGVDVQIPTGLHMYGDGRATVLQATADCGAHPLRNADLTNGNNKIRLHDFAFDGNKANITGDSTITGNPNQSIWFAAADGHTCDGVSIERLYIHDCKRLGLGFANAINVDVRACTIEDNARDGLTFYYSCKDVTVEGNRIRRCGDDYIGVNAEDGTGNGHLPERFTIRGNTLVGPATNGKGKGIIVRGGKGISILGNVIDSTSDVGITVSDYNLTPSTHIDVADNTIRNCGQDAAGSSGKNGILIDANNAADHTAGTDWAYIRNVTVAGNRISECGAAGIALRSNHGATDELRDVLVAGNHVNTCTGEGILLGGGTTNPVTDVTISGNHVNACTSHGISISNSTHKRIWLLTNVCSSNGGDGITVDRVQDLAVIHPCVINNTGVGLRLTVCTGKIKIDPGVSTNNAGANYSFITLNSTSFELGFLNTPPTGKQVVAAAATDAATTQTLANNLRASLIAYGML